jgi:threonylcarbamoyladenosine tRNA methylthiotransferase MtaB
MGDDQYNKLCLSRVGEVENVLVERDGVGRTEQFIPIAVPGRGAGELVAVRVTGTSTDGLTGEAIRSAA